MAGEEKVETRGTSTMGHMVEGVKDDDLVGQKETVAHGAFVEEGARVVARDWGIVIQPGVFGVSRVERTANEVIVGVVICFEGRTKIQKKQYASIS